jgi:hypothetical protein
MGRQVYRREGKDKWIHLDTGVLQEPSLTEVKGFNSIDGVDENDIYAVGFGGDMWHCMQGIWQELDSPTNLILNKVLVVNDKQVYICGQKGVLLAGHGDRWTTVEQDLEDEDFWDMTWYREALYLSSNKAVYRLDPNDNTLTVVDFNLGDKMTYGFVHANDGVLASFGTKHVCITKDGVNWEDIT